MLVLRHEVYKAEERAYDLFNELNTDDEFDVICKLVAPTGTRLEKRVCRPRFEDSLRAQAAREYVENITSGGFSSTGTTEALIKRKHKQFMIELEAITTENPELLAAFLEFYDARKIAESEHERRCEGRLILCKK